MATITSVPVNSPDPEPFATLESVPDLLPQPLAHYTAAQRSGKFYPAYRIETFYRGCTGLKQMPTAGALGTPARVVRTSAPYAKKLVVWQAWRFGEKPVLPHWDGGNGAEVLADYLVIPGSATLLPGGQTYLHRCAGAYLYYLLTVPCMTDSFYSGATPLFDASAEQLKTEGFQFARNLLRSLPPSGYTGTADQQFRTVDTTSTLTTQGGTFPGP